MKKNDILLVVRPSLAVALIAAGCPFEKRPHPWKPQWTAWAFPVTDKVKEIALPYYAEWNKPVPKCLWGDFNDA